MRIDVSLVPVAELDACCRTQLINNERVSFALEANAAHEQVVLEAKALNV